MLSKKENIGWFIFLATLITLATIKGNNTIACEKEVNHYIRDNISTNKILINASDLEKWDQHMVNAFYKYCLEKSVLPKIELTSHRLQLIGLAQDVEKATQKYKLMSEIVTLKSGIHGPPPVARRSSIAGRNQLNSASSSGYNIAFSYCSQDQVACSQLTTSLINEGYSLCQTSANTFLSQSQIEKADLMLVYFSENYSQDARCMADLNHTKSRGIKIIPIATTKNDHQDLEENSWLNSMTNAQLFYDLFDIEIEVEFTDDYELEYDKLLTILVSRKLIFSRT